MDSETNATEEHTYKVREVCVVRLDLKTDGLHAEGLGAWEEIYCTKGKLPNKTQENLSVIIEKCNILSFNLKIFVLELIQFNFFHNKPNWVKQYKSTMKKRPRE